MKERKSITVVLLLLGQYERQLYELDRKIQEMKQLQDTVEVVVAGDHDIWSAIPAIQMLQLQNPDMQFIFLSQRSLPAAVMNAAMSKDRTPYVLFSLLGDPIVERVDLFGRALRVEEDCQKGTDERDKMPAFYLCPAPDSQNRDVYQPAPENLYGWAMSSEKSFCLGSFCAPVQLLHEAGKFDENPLLKDEIERWYALLVTAGGTAVAVGAESHYVKRLREYPLSGKSVSGYRDLAVRYATYCRGSAAEKRLPEECAKQFADDLCDADARLYAEITGIHRSKKLSNAKRYRILIVGGFWEYHHNQICFMNYLERMYGKGFATFRSVFEYHCPVNLVLDYDLVIFSRCRSQNMLRMAKLCEERGIATLYMIDDNWMSIAKDHPKQGAIFVPGNENYDNFVEALGLCKATWLFSDVLRQDVLPYTKCVKKFKISADPMLFRSDRTRTRSDDQLYVGFSGSLRYNDGAFQALARYARRHANIVVILIGILSPEQEMLFKNLKTIRLPFSSYNTYARNVAAIVPDLLIAPLEHTRTMESKCYNKYVESGIVGSACVFSKCKPYTDVVKEGFNGYFVEDESPEGWYQKLEEILADTKKLRSVQKRAQEDVMCNHTVDRLLQGFCDKLGSVVEGENLKDD